MPLKNVGDSTIISCLNLI